MSVSSHAHRVGTAQRKNKIREDEVSTGRGESVQEGGGEV